MSEVNNATGIANPFINDASTLTQSATQPIGAQQINQVMNPYLSDVASTTSAEINQNNAIQQNQLQGNAAALGALGGNRVGTAQSQLANQQDLAENSALANVYSGGFNTALGAAQTTNAQQLQGADVEAGLGSEAQNTALTGANAQLSAGSTAQTEQQNQLNSAFSQFEASQAFPFESSQFLTNTLEGLGSLEGGTGATTIPAPSEFSQVVGGIGSIAGIVGDLKRGGRVGRAAGGLAGMDGGGGVVDGSNVNPNFLAGLAGSSGGVGSTLPAAPNPVDPNAGTDGSQSGKSSSGGSGGGGLGSLIGIAGALKRGGRAGYDLGGDIPYDSGSANFLDGIIGSGSSGAHGNTLPKPPPGVDPNAGTDGSKTGSSSAAQTGASAASGIKDVVNQFEGNNNGIGDSMGNNGTDNSIVSHQGGDANETPTDLGQFSDFLANNGFARGGRTNRADGGTSSTAAPASTTDTTSDIPATPSAGISTSISPGQESLEEEMENYSLESSLMPGAQAPKYSYSNPQPTENPIASEQQSEGQPLARGGLARLKRASGGTGTAAQSGLASFTPVGNQAITAPQPTSTAGTQPTTWGNVTLPSAPQLSTAPVQQMTPQSIQQSIALPAGGIQNNYTGYIEGLQGSNPSIGNVAPGANTFGAIPTTGAPASEPDTINPFALTSSGLSPEQLAGFGMKSGGRAGYDDGGGIDYQAAGPAMPIQPPPTGLTALGNVPVPVQSAPLPAPSPPPQTPPPSSPSPGLGAVPPTGTPAPPSGPPIKPTPVPQGLAAVAPQAQSSAITQPPVNNPGNLKVPGSKTAFQQFSTPIAGMDAMSDQLALDNKPLNEGGHGLTTLASLIGDPVHGWAPAGENDTASYIKNVSAETGIAPDAPLDLSDPKTMAAVQGAMVKQEQGSKGVQVAQNNVQQPGFVNGQTASDASPGLGYANPGQPALGNPGFVNVSTDPYSQEQNDPTQAQKLSDNPWLALAAAGFATMAGTSPYAAVNIGQGGLAGIQYLQGIQGQQRENAGVQQAQTSQQQATTGQKQQQEIAQANNFSNVLGAIPGISGTQRAAISQNFQNSILGLPMVQVPGLPAGLPPAIASYAPGYSGAAGGNSAVNTAQNIAQNGIAPPAPQSTTGSVGGAPQANSAAQDPTQMMAPAQIGSLSVPAQTPMQRAMTMANYSGIGGMVGQWAQDQAGLAQEALKNGSFVNQYGKTVNVAGAPEAAAQAAGVAVEGSTQQTAYSSDVTAAQNTAPAMSSLFELESAAKKANPGPLSANLAYVNTLGAQINAPTATNQAEAEQVANKAAGMLLASNLTNFGPSTDAKLGAAMGITPNTTMSMGGILATGAMTAGAKLYQFHLGQEAQGWQASGGDPTDQSKGYNNFKTNFQSLTSPLVLALPFMPPEQIQDVNSYMQTLPPDQQALFNNQVKYSIAKGWLTPPPAQQANP
jgi:hypothetical protein